MHRRRTSFGKALEEKGDFRRALGAYQNAGLIEDAQRMQTVLETVETAGKLEKIGLYRRAVDLLLEHGLAGEAKALSQRVGPNGVRESDYVLLRVFSDDRNAHAMEGPASHLMRLDSYAKLLAGLAVSGQYPEATEWIADGLSGKERKEAVRDAGKRPGQDDDKPEPKMFISAGDAKEMANTMVSMLFMAMDNEAEMAFHAMKLYHKLGKVEDAERCRVIASECEELRFYAALAEGGYQGVIGKGFKFDNNMRLVVAISDGHADMAVQAIEKIRQTDEERLGMASDILYEMEKFAPERLSTDSVFAIIGYMDRKRQALREQNARMLDGFKAHVASGNLEDIKAGMKMLESIKFRYLDVSYHDMKRECADAAMEFDSTEAVAFAAGLYSDASEKKLECAEILLTRGIANEAGIIFASMARAVSYDLYSQRENHAVNPHSVELKERLVARAFSLEAIHPVISLSVYQGFHEHDGAIRVAGTLLASQNLGEVESAAWAVSVFEKRSMLMRDLLLRLDSFGGEGKKRADGIRLEMRVPGLFIAKNGTG